MMPDRTSTYDREQKPGAAVQNGAASEAAAASQDVNNQLAPPLGEFSTVTRITLEELLEKTPADSRDLVRKAYEVAAEVHEGQTRSSGEAYIHHPLMVASYLADLNMDGPSIAAGLLHDVLEDTHITREEFSEIFPSPVPEIVQGVTKISKINFSTTREAQVENLRMMILAMARDIRVVIVKLCDRLHNMKTLKYLSPERRLKISQETIDIYAPLANRLGMSRIKVEMEDLAMRWLMPDAYQKLTRSIATKRKEREQLVHESIEYLRNYLSRHYKNLTITGRPKHFFSIYKKMKEQGLTFDQIYDLNAIRIMAETESQCYEIMGLIHAVWHPVPGRIKDYIGMPKKNMYQSLHTTVIGYKGARTEIQIRTRSMHQVAEFGIAAHWKYKEQVGELKMDERLAWLRQLTEWITDVNEPTGLLDALKKDVFADRVMCFTPKGDVIELPANGTPIDFAYAIHTKVGETCIGAKINDRIVNLRTKLQNGDVVAVLSSPTGHPSRDWLDYAVTGRARQKIKHWLKGRNTDEWVENGRKALQHVLHERRINVTQQELEHALETLLPVYRLQTINDLLVEIGFGSISASAAIARANPEWVKRPEPVGKRTPVNKRDRSQTGPIIVEELEGTPTRIANCCNPIPGDPIMAYVTRGRGLTIHHSDCRSAIKAQKDPEEAKRILSAMWSMEGLSAHTVIIRVVAEDRSGLLNDITGTLSRHNIFINGCVTKSDRKKNIATLQFEVNVKDVGQVEAVLNAIRAEKGIVLAERKRRLDNR